MLSSSLLRARMMRVVALCVVLLGVVLAFNYEKYNLQLTTMQLDLTNNYLSGFCMNHRSWQGTCCLPKHPSPSHGTTVATTLTPLSSKLSLLVLIPLYVFSLALFLLSHLFPLSFFSSPLHDMITILLASNVSLQTLILGTIYLLVLSYLSIIMYHPHISSFLIFSRYLAPSLLIRVYE